MQNATQTKKVSMIASIWNSMISSFEQRAAFRLENDPRMAYARKSYIKSKSL